MKKKGVGRFRRLCRVIVGYIFTFSGILKLLDPVGAGLVMDEYYNFLHLGFMSPTAKIAGTLLALAETLIGVAMVTGVWRRFFAIAAMAMQGFFTLLTLALVIFQPEMDCGCFGEAIHLTHGETFIKNILLCILLAIAYIPISRIGRPRKKKFVSFGIIAASVLAFTVYSWLYIPLVNFTDYKYEAQLTSASSSASELYEAVFIYEKDGIQESFDMDELPDSTWTFVSTQVNETETEKRIVPLSFSNKEAEYMDYLAAEGKVMIISIYDVEKINEKKWTKISQFITQSSQEGIIPLIIVAGTPESVSVPESLSDYTYYSDYKTLISLNRSNGGCTLFIKGVLAGKYAFRAMPKPEKLREISSANELELATNNEIRGNLIFRGFLLYIVAIMFLI